MIHCEIRKPQRLKLRRYMDRLIDLNKYLASLPGSKLTDKIGIMELNESLSNIMPNGWSKQVYVQGFYSESITWILICMNTWRLLSIFTKV